MNQLFKIIITLLQSINRKLLSVKWTNLRSVKPVSIVFGKDRGKPIDRYYIEQFLSDNKEKIKGTVIEIGDNLYTKEFGENIEKSEVLHYTSDNPMATIIGDLCDTKTLPESKADCFICTQTLNFIYDFKAAIKGAHYLLKENGIALFTVAGISQISRYDMDRWGDYWRFTTKSIEQAFSDVFNTENLVIKSYGNVLSAISFLEGISAEEITEKELNFRDENYQVVITIEAKKTTNKKS